MKHFCQLDTDGTILNISVVADTDTQDPQTSSFDESIGIAFCRNLTGHDSWVAVTPERVGHAMIGGKYDAAKDLFVKIKPYPSWTFNESTGKLDPPVPYPDGNEDGKNTWNEETQTWEPWS